MEWTEQLGDKYRAQYPALSFEKKKRIMDLVLQNQLQIVVPPRFLFKCLSQIKQRNLHIVELGGYDGTHALDVLESYPNMSWVNYDISATVSDITRSELEKYNYRLAILDQPFNKQALGNFDLFYSSKTLEHMSIGEVQETLSATRKAKYQVHIVDWFWKDDTHVIERGKHDEIIRHLEALGYAIRHVDKYESQSRIFCYREDADD